MKKSIFLCLAGLLLQVNGLDIHSATLASRKVDVKKVRLAMLNQQLAKGFPAPIKNTNEDTHADKRASFGKALEQLSSGLIDPLAFQQLVYALESGDSEAFELINMGTSPVERRLVDPQAAFAFATEGADSWQLTMPAAPELESAQHAGEMVECYQHALLRDVPFNDYGTDSKAAAAIADLDALSDFKGPKDAGSVTAGTLFRGSHPGELTGPYISQFLYLPVPYGPGSNFSGGPSGTAGIDFQAQDVPTSSTTNDFMTTVAKWKDVQKGKFPVDTLAFTGTRTFIRNGRDLGDYVHNDTPQQPYLNATMILLGFGEAALDQNNPFIGNPTQEAFTTYFVPDILNLVSQAAESALCAAWYQKWRVHRRLRPEFSGFLAHEQKNGTPYGLHADLINSQALTDVYTAFGTYLLPQAYPEGSPTHPSYPAGHAVVAGACVTILKAFFNEDFVIASGLEPNAANTALVSVAGLKVGDELNKLASNISLGRDIAGVHYRSDGHEGNLLGEKVAIAMLEDYSYRRNMPFDGFSLTKFDGTTILIGEKHDV